MKKTVNKINRFLAVLLSLMLVFAVFAACDGEPTPSDDSSSLPSSDKTSSDTVSVDYTFDSVDFSAALDGKTDTFWQIDSEEEVSFEFKSKEPITFNAIKFTEYQNYLTDIKVELKQGEEYLQLCRLEEMGIRTSVLDKTYTGSDFRITVTMSDITGGIKEMEFAELNKIENSKGFRKVGYFCASSMDSIRNSSYDKLGEYTDIILFDYGSWNEKGEFLWGSMYERVNEAQLVDVLKEIKSVKGTEDLRIWFCIQNYDKANIKDTETLFKTAASREKLANFAVDLCKKYGFYGIDVDYEYPETAKAWDQYADFLSLCADKLHSAGYKISVALSPWGSKGEKLQKEAAPKLDYVNVMAYDYLNADGNRHSSYALADRSLKYFTDIGFKTEQLTLGIPFYRRTMDATQTSGGGYNDCLNRWREGLKPWVNVATNKTWVYYFNGPDMIRDKVYFAMSNNMGGVFCWSLRNDIPNDNEYGAPSLGQTIIDTVERFEK